MQLTPLLNRATDGSWQLPADGWYQVAPLGEFPHAPSGQTQVIDPEAVAAMSNTSSGPANILVDYDHFSYRNDQSSEAAGWITEMQPRPDGLWARIRWTPGGEAAVREGRFRFLSPVWLPRDVLALAGQRIRPLRLDSAGLTNNPNLRGIAPLCNRGEAVGRDTDMSVGGDTLTPSPGLRPPSPVRRAGEGEGQRCAPCSAPHAPVNHTLGTGGASPAGPRHERKPMKQVCTELGLAEGASEDSALAALQALKNRHTALEAAHRELLAAQVEADLDRYQNRFAADKREPWKAALLANRATALALLETIPSPAGGPPLHNRAEATTPPPIGSGSGVEWARQQKAAVEGYRNSHGCSFQEAWRAVRAEQPALFTEARV